MTQKKPPGYLLPSGELGEDELVCQLVYLPDRSEYWQALLAAIHYFTTWRAWERDTDKRGKDAAANWRAAFELTIGCWRMTCLEDLTQSVDDILELMQTRKDCCDDNITYLPVDEIDTDIIPNDGEPPEFYGETEVADWDEWLEYLCYSANKYVDYLAHVGDTLLQAVVTGSVIIGLIAGGLALLASGGYLLPVSYTVAAGVTSAIIGAATLLTFDDTEDLIEAARVSIVCAILSGRSLSDAVEAALSSNTAWDLFYQWIPYDNAIAIMYEGGFEGEFLTAEKDDSCVCTCPHTFVTQGTHNTVIYQSVEGAQVEFTRHLFDGDNDVISGDVIFNRISGGVYCEGMKTIDSISVNDGLEFRNIVTKDGNHDIIWDSGNTGDQCTIDIEELIGRTMQRFYLQRNPPGDGGCGVGDITITMTYHDAA